MVKLDTRNETQSTLESPGDRKAVLSQTLRQRIITMEMPPGSIVDEIELSEEFGVSRSPLRELMRQLASEGYIELKPNRPARVSSMTHHSLRCFFLAAPLLYAATTQLAAMNASPKDILKLKEIQMAFRNATKSGSVVERVQYNDQFHLEVGHIANNPYLMPSLCRVLIDHARLGMTFYQDSSCPEMQDDLALAVTQHDQMIDAIERHDAQEAGQLVSAHMELSRRRMADYAAPAGLDISLYS